MKRIAVVGSTNKDTIILSDGSQSQSIGGILYTALAVSFLSNGKYENWLFSQIGNDIYGEVEQVFQGCPHLVTDGVKVFAGANPHCRIQYHQSGHKIEHLTGTLKKFRANELLPYLVGMDLLLINFITGYELSLQTLYQIRKQFNGLIIMDIHSLTLGRRNSGERYFRTLDNWRDWIRLADIVQMNEQEAAFMGEAESTLPSFIKDVLGLGCKGVVITRGEKGCIAGEWQGGKPVIFEKSALMVHKTIDTTGCGDVFLAGLATGYLEDFDLQIAINKATKAAALNCSLQGIAKLNQLSAICHFL